MTLIRWNPRFELESFFNEDVMGQRQFAPSLDIIQNEDTITVTAAIPGVKKEDINIDIQDNVLTIKGTVHQESKEEGKEFFREEILKGSFARSVRLPSEVNADTASAETKNGMLKVTIPKSAKVLPKNIEITSGE